MTWFCDVVFIVVFFKTKKENNFKKYSTTCWTITISIATCKWLGLPGSKSDKLGEIWLILFKHQKHWTRPSGVYTADILELVLFQLLRKANSCFGWWGEGGTGDPGAKTTIVLPHNRLPQYNCKAYISYKVLVTAIARYSTFQCSHYDFDCVHKTPDCIQFTRQESSP